MFEFDDDEEPDVFEEALKGSKRAKSGVDLELEFTADRMLANARKGTTRHSEMSDYFSVSQIARRLQKEVFPNSGTPDPHLYSGNFRRVHAPDKSAGPTQGRLEFDYVFPVTVRKIESSEDAKQEE